MPRTEADNQNNRTPFSVRHSLPRLANANGGRRPTKIGGRRKMIAGDSRGDVAESGRPGYSFEPQYLQWVASLSCPSAMQSAHTCVVWLRPPVCAISAETIPVGTMIMQ